MPMSFEQGRTIMPHQFGRMEASRAVNPSAGNDPLSLGLLSAPAGVSTLSADEISVVVPAAGGLQLTPPPPLAPASGQGPITQPVPGAVPAGIHVNLTEGAALLNGRALRLTPDAQTAILEILLEAYEVSLRQEMDQLRAEFGLLPDDIRQLLQSQEGGTRPEVREAYLPTSLVRLVPGEAAPRQPEEQGQPEAPDVQPVPKRARRKRGVPVVPGGEEGAGTAAPQA